MNYLAHFYLAAPEPDLMFGNYIGDGVKGSDFRSFNDEVVRGIKFHRFIDTFTDSHPIVGEAKRFFYPTQAKYSGVVVDVLFDHMLAVNWAQYHEETLPNFAQFCYETVGDHNHEMPTRSSLFYRYMVSDDILANYATVSGIRNVFRGMDSRTSFKSNMLDSVDTLSEIRSEFEALFNDFFPLLDEACQEWKETN